MKCLCKWYKSEKREYRTYDGDCIFHCQKYDWYEEKDNSGGKKVKDWSKSSGENGMTEKFWKAIREKMKSENDDSDCKEYDFCQFIFPSFQSFLCEMEIQYDILPLLKDFLDTKSYEDRKVQKNDNLVFWEAGQNKTFHKKVNFSDAKFLDDVNFCNVSFSSGAIFFNAKFLDNASFNRAIFSGEVVFSRVFFSERANFSEVSFLGRVVLIYSKFSKEVSFFQAKFLEEVDFSRSKFSGRLNLSETKFSGKTVFRQVSFLGKSIFDSALFSEKVDFFNAKFFGKTFFLETAFSHESFFLRVEFSEGVFFSKSEFSGRTLFSESKFFNNVNFSEVKFSKETVFSWAKFFGGVNFSNSSFSSDCQTFFEGTKFLGYDKKSREIISAKFQNILFPEKAIFRLCDLSRVSFLKSNIEKARFDECEWRRRGIPIYAKSKIISFEKLKIRNILWDEYGILQIEKDSARRSGITAQLYNQVANLNRQLKKNFDDKKDFQVADDFYVGEMEMRVRALRLEGNWSELFFLWFYRNISSYNSDPIRSLWSLICIFVIFSITYSLCLTGFLKFKDAEWLEAFHFSFTSTIPLLSLPKNIGDYVKDEMINSRIVLFYYAQRILSVIAWSLLVLSIHKKFKR